MATMNFPSNPTQGQEYTFENFVYVWDGEKWTTRVAIADDPDDRYVNITGDTMEGNIGVHRILSSHTGRDVVIPYAENNAGIYWGNTDQWSRIFAKSGLVQVYDGASIWRAYHEGFKPTPAAIGAVPSTGGTVTGDLTVKSGSGAHGAIVYTTNDEAGIKILNDAGQYISAYTSNGATGDFSITTATNGTYSHSPIRYNKAVDAVLLTNPRAGGAQANDPASLTRKDYVDTFTAAAAKELTPKNASWGVQTDRFTTGSAQAPHGSGRTEYVDWIQWGHNGGQKMRHTLWCPADGSKPSELWFATQTNTTDTDGPATHWRVYHQGFKPTASDIGALALGGGTMTGAITGKTSGGVGSGGSFVANTTGGMNADMWQRRAPFHTNVSHGGSSYAPSLSMYYHDTEGWEGNWSIGTLGSTGAGADMLQIYHYQGSAAGGPGVSFTLTSTGQLNLPSAPNAAASATRKDYVDGYAARKRAVIASGGNFTGYSMACAMMSLGGRTYPLTFPLVAGTYWIRNRGGENADRDYDFGVTVGGTAPNFTFAVAGSQGATVGNIHAW